MSSQTIGRYEILHELGQGGMAIVYLARDPFVNRQVAIKVLPRQFTFDPQFRARFKREAEAVASLEHSAIVPVYDYGEADEQPFIVMRYMPGGTLQDRIGKPETRTSLVPILNRIAQALDEAHSRGIIHRDLKPSNVLFDAWGEAYLSDFGIAKLAESSGTYSGSMMLGTPAYMSPEQARGERNVDGRSDIYSLGVLLFEILTGRKPYEADTPMGIAVKHVTEPVPSILAAKPDLPAVYEQIISKAMAKEKTDRYQKGMDLARAVSEVLAGAATVTPPMPSAPAEVTRVAVVDEPASAPATPAPAPAPAPVTPPAVAAPATPPPAPPVLEPALATAVVAAPPQPAAQTMASSVAATPSPVPVRRPASRAPVAVMAVGVLLLAVLAIGGGALAVSWMSNRATATPAPSATVPASTEAAPTQALPTFTAAAPLPTDTAAPAASNTAAPSPTEAAPTDTPPPAATATLAATATRTQPAVTLAPPTATAPPAGCPGYTDCAAATADAAAEQTQNALDATAGVPTAEP
jgi:tRNA A-37 threonylcarbamoyl transferase component Bud32